MLTERWGFGLFLSMITLGELSNKGCSRMATAQTRTTVRLVNAAGVVKDVPESAIEATTAAGYLKVTDGSGTTAQRPTVGLYRGFTYYDTTLSKIIVWVGGGGGMNVVAPTGFWTDGSGSAV